MASQGTEYLNGVQAFVDQAWVLPSTGLVVTSNQADAEFGHRRKASVWSKIGSNVWNEWTSGQSPDKYPLVILQFAIENGDL